MYDDDDDDDDDNSNSLTFSQWHSLISCSLSSIAATFYFSIISSGINCYIKHEVSVVARAVVSVTF